MKISWDSRTYSNGVAWLQSRLAMVDEGVAIGKPDRDAGKGRKRK